jgi:hypothetical protein
MEGIHALVSVSAIAFQQTNSGEQTKTTVADAERVLVEPEQQRSALLDERVRDDAELHSQPAGNFCPRHD